MNCYADVIKQEIRRQICLQELRSPSRSFEEAMGRAKKWWTEYDEVNERLCPEDPVFCFSRTGIALSTTADLMDIQAQNPAQVRILEIIIGGEATASAVNRVACQRVSAFNGTTLTATAFRSRSGGARSNGAFGNTASLSGNPTLVLAFNALGGFVRWVALPGEEIIVQDAEIFGLRSLSGTSTVSATMIFEEV